MMTSMVAPDPGAPDSTDCDPRVDLSGKVWLIFYGQKWQTPLLFLTEVFIVNGGVAPLWKKHEIII